MTFFDAFKLLLALGLLFGGIRYTSRNLRRLSGGAFHRLLREKVSTPGSGFLLGTVASAFLQSSSAVTVVAVSFINGGILNLQQGLGIVIGANVGTTVTAQFLAMESRQLLLPLIAAGASIYALEVIFKKEFGGKVLLGIAFMLSGVELLSTSLASFSTLPFYRELYSFGSDSVWKGIFMGAFSSAVIQSSSVTIGMLIALAREKMIYLPEALAMVLGADLGTCVTSLMASIGTVVPARRVAWGHFVFNLFSIFLVLPFWYYFVLLVSLTSASFPQQIANAHAIYNITGALLIMPFIDKFAILLQYIVRERVQNLTGGGKGH